MTLLPAVKAHANSSSTVTSASAIGQGETILREEFGGIITSIK